jgi:hypothetical protein
VASYYFCSQVLAGTETWSGEVTGANMRRRVDIQSMRD